MEMGYAGLGKKYKLDCDFTGKYVHFVYDLYLVSLNINNLKLIIQPKASYEMIIFKLLKKV